MTDQAARDLPDLGIEAVFDHAAAAAPRIRDLLPIYLDLLGGTFHQGGDNSRVGYRAVQIVYPGGGKMELMEPHPGSTFFDRFFASRGAGLHHLTFKVPDIDAAIAAVERAGYTPTSIYTADRDWKEVFLHPKESHGVLIQLAQAAAGFPRPAEGRQTLDDVLAGRGDNGTGVPSP
ncbi:MAG: VOC family protein [Acidimicrobiia bacterium]|nr:VOC family protein [Acidimicrobiia bacterium]